MVAAAAKLMSKSGFDPGSKKNRYSGKMQHHNRHSGNAFIRLQPNHPTDDPEGISSSIREGLSYGSGDAVIGINPVGGIM
jgi:ethanolamine ammonia-lyase large subunit